MGFILLTPPRDAHKSVKESESWIAELASLAKLYGHDPDIRAQIEHERLRSEATLKALRDRAGQ